MSEAIDVITGETEVSTTELACVLGITGRRIRQMAEDGQLQKVSKGRFLLADSVQRYVKFLSDGPMDEEDKKLEKTRRVAETTMKASKATIAKLKTEYKGKVDILCGIEWDILSEDKRTGYDYWIGSAHHLYGKNTGKYYEIDFRPQDLWDCINDDFDADPLAAVEAYFAEVEKVAALKPDILAHIDLIKKLNAKGEFFDEESPRYKAAALKALQAAKDNDCLLEVSTGGVYRGYRKDFYPGPWLLGEWQKMGGKVIITSDSHDIASLTYGFDEAAAAIQAAGFTSVEVLTGHGFETQEL